MILLIGINTVLYSFELLKVQNSNYSLTTEEKLFETYILKIKPHYKKVPLRFFEGEDNISIAYKIFKVNNSKGSIIIVSGRTESMLKYQELIYDLSENNYSVFIFDHRGQGLSGRTQDVDSQLGDVIHFENYVEDMKTFVNTIVKKESDKQLFILSHSMGATISSLYLQKYHDDFKAAVLSSPMHEVKMGFISPLICGFLQLFKKDSIEYMLGTSRYDEPYFWNTYKLFTRSTRRFALVVEGYESNVSSKIGGVSHRWLAQACEFSSKSVENAKQIKTPYLLLQAQERFCEASYEFCTAYTLENSEHEVFIERDGIRNRALSKILDYYEKSN